MSIAEKLITIAENEPRVYEAGKISQIQGVEPAEVDPSLFSGKLKTIAENTIRVFEKGRADANLQKAVASGEVIRADDVSPIEHSLGIQLCSKNLFDFSQLTGSYYRGLADHDNKTFTIEAGCHNVVTEKLSKLCPMLKVGDIVRMSFDKSNSEALSLLYFYPVGITVQAFAPFTITQDMLDNKLTFFNSSGTANDNIISNLQIEIGTTATAYAPYITDFSGVTVSRYGRNLLNLKNRVERNFGDGSNTTIRNFTENSVYKGIAVNNYYFGGNDFNSYSVSENAVTINHKAWNGYGIGLNVRVKPNTTYTFSFANYDKNKHSPAFSSYNQQGVWQKAMDVTAGNYTFTTPDEAYWLMIVFRASSGTTNTDVVFENPQLEVGSTATDYEPYKEPQTAIALADGGVQGLKSLSPTMTLVTDTEGVNINLEYYKQS